MSLHIERECGWCFKRVSIIETKVPWTVLGIESSIPEGWQKDFRDPVTKKYVDLCTECREILARAEEEGRKLRLKLIEDAKPREPRRQSDEKMRRLQRKRRADGQS